MVKNPSIKFNKKTKFLMILGLVFCFTCFFLIGAKISISKADTGLIAYWNFDEMSGWEIQDQSGSDINGYIASALSGVSGQKEYALLFDGSGDYATMGNLAGLDFGPDDSFSVSAWVKLDDSISDYRVILGKADNSSIDGYMLRHETDGRFSMNIEESDGQDQANTVTEQDYLDGQWHYLVGVIDRVSNTNTIYVDGFEQGQVDISQIGDLTNNYHFNIGSLENGGVSFKGLVDEVRIYNRTLSLTEISQLYNQDCQCDGIAYYIPGSLLRANDNKIYYINKKNQKKWIINEEVFNLYNNKWEDIIEVELQELEVYPIVNLIKAANDEKIYFIQGMTKQWIETTEEFEQAGYQWEDIDVVMDLEIDEYVEE